MRNTQQTTTVRGQRGAATIFITIVLLLAVGLIALYTNRAAIMEQRLSANEIRAKQAFAAANAGIEAALAHWRGPGINLVNSTSVDTIALATLGGNPGGAASYYQARYCNSDPTVVHPPCPTVHTAAMSCFAGAAPAALDQIVVVSCGWSDDNTSVQRVTQIVGPSESTGGNVQTPLIARGTANLLTGGATIMNYFNDLNVWSGLSMLGQSNTGKTFVRNIVTDPTASSANFRNVGNSPACNNAPTGYECSTQGSTMGHDTVTGDTNLSSKTATEFFQYLFGKDVTAYRDTTATYIVDPAGTLPNRDTTNVSTIVGKTNEVIWIEGTPGVPVSLPNGTPVIGAQGKPVLLIINGDLDMSSFNGEINGMVYVHGNVSGGGSPTIYGAMVVGGDANVTGNLKIVFDPGTLTPTGGIGKAAKLPGTWRDW